jgi:hypothetical protein
LKKHLAKHKRGRVNKLNPVSLSKGGVESKQVTSQASSMWRSIFTQHLRNLVAKQSEYDSQRKPWGEQMIEVYQTGLAWDDVAN